MNTIYKHNTKTKDKYNTNIPLNKWNVIYNNETKNTTIWHVCQTKQIYKTKYWHNHQTSKRKNKNTTNFKINNPVQLNKNINTKYKIKTIRKYSRTTSQNQYTKIHYYSFDKTTILLRSRDIETNPGPMPNILETHPHHTDVDTKHILSPAQ